MKNNAKTKLTKTIQEYCIERGISYDKNHPEGWVLAHNTVRCTRTTRHGDRGFRRFWANLKIVKPEEKWKLCACGWRPDLGPHYASR